jgi:hypothetical protein
MQSLDYLAINRHGQSSHNSAHVAVSATAFSYFLRLMFTNGSRLRRSSIDANQIRLIAQQPQVLGFGDHSQRLG